MGRKREQLDLEAAKCHRIYVHQSPYLFRGTVLFNVTGTLGVLEIAAEKRLLSLPQAIAALRHTSFRVSQQLLDEVLQRHRDRQRSAEHEADNGVTE